MADDTCSERSGRSRSRSALAGVHEPDRGDTVAWRTGDGAAVSISYPGTPASVPAARSFVRGALAASPRVDDLELITAELMTNAIRHTPSGHDGGTVTITVLSVTDGARIEVTDLGSGPIPATPSRETLSEDGRGLLIVSALADKAGCDLAMGRTNCAWAEVTWLGRPARARDLASP